MARTSPVEKAKQVLKVAWDGRLPVYPEKIARKMKVRWKHNGRLTKHMVLMEGQSNAELNGDSGFAEFQETVPGQPFRCVYNKDEILPRRRFTMAHELGHILLGHVKSGAKPKRDNNFNANGDWDEVDANAFAAELLMPETHVVHFLNQGMDISSMADKFLVSPTAMRYRLQRLGLLKPNKEYL
tara:strand:- start:3572 stop:4123 length:552 start_codon:yes stop_codon:yes gene_type:complete